MISARGVSYSTPRRKGKTEIEYKGEICPCNFVFIFRLQIFVISSSLYNYYGPLYDAFGSQYRASEATRFLLFYWWAWACSPILPSTGLQLVGVFNFPSVALQIAMVMKKKKKKMTHWDQNRTLKSKINPKNLLLTQNRILTTVTQTIIHHLKPMSLQYKVKSRAISCKWVPKEERKQQKIRHQNRNQRIDVTSEAFSLQSFPNILYFLLISPLSFLHSLCQSQRRRLLIRALWSPGSLRKPKSRDPSEE